MPFARNESGIAGQTEKQRARQRKDDVGEREELSSRLRFVTSC